MTLETIINEASVVQAAREGSRTAFGELVKLYQKRAYGIAYGFVRNRDDALEIAQESFAKAYKAMDRFDTDLPFYPWLYRIVKNTCLNHIKKRQRRGETSLDALRESGFQVKSTKHGPDHGAALSELQQCIASSLESLSEEHREIVVLRHVHEHSYKEIAEFLDIPQGTVMSRLHAARNRWRDVLQTTPAADHVLGRTSEL